MTDFNPTHALPSGEPVRAFRREDAETIVVRMVSGFTTEVRESSLTPMVPAPAEFHPTHRVFGIPVELRTDPLATFRPGDAPESSRVLVMEASGWMHRVPKDSLTPLGVDRAALAPKVQGYDAFEDGEEEDRAEEAHIAHAAHCAPCGADAANRVTLANWAEALEAARASLQDAVAEVLAMAGTDGPGWTARRRLEKAVTDAGARLASFRP